MTTFSTFFVGNSVMNNVPMSSTTLDSLWQRLRNDAQLSESVERLRKVKRLDAQAYSRLKVTLPFFCCATFSDGIRHSRGFESVAAFVVDIDKYSSETEVLETLRKRIIADERVALCFVSPSGDGLKVVFELAQPCFDLKVYSDFYKSFVYEWAQGVEVSSYVDLRTTDATRACFLSFDSAAFINPMAEKVVLEQYLPALSLFTGADGTGFEDTDVLVQGAAVATTSKPAAKTFAPDANCSHHIQPDTYSEILAALKAKARPNPLQRGVVVPDAVMRLIPMLEKVLMQHDIKILATRAVNYGQQVQMQCGNDLAEINVYFGKSGFSVVLSNKKGVHPMLTALCGQLAEQTIFAQSATAYQVSDPLLN